MKDFNAKETGKRIQELRSEKFLQQKELAEKVGVKQNSISRYESGVIVPSMEVLVHLAQVLDTTTDYLLGLSDFD